MLEQRLNLKMTQKLIMTPQLQQAIKLLQYQKLELQEVLNQELVENPVLEEVEETPEPTPEAEREQAEAAEREEKDPIEDIDFEAYFQDYLDSGPPRTARETPEEMPSVEATTAKSVSLAEHLLWQLGELTEPELTKQIARAIIGNINGDGWLQASLEEIASMGNWPLPEVERALRCVQRLDPVGVGARGLIECLLLQLAQLGLEDSPAAVIIQQHLELLKRWKIEEIARRMEIGTEEVLAAVEVVRRLDPKPGVRYESEGSQYVVPDVYVVKVDGEYKVTLNEDGMPRLRISPIYRRLLADRQETSAETRQYVNEKLRAAIWLIRSLDQRQKTILKVAESIVRYQKSFFDRGVEFLTPLVLRDVADDIGMHESTVSRVVTNKYMHTPRGLFEMKYFFHSSIQSDRGHDVSSLSVKQKIKNYIESEDPERPLSDAKIVDLLRREGLEIARRTVAKYREELKIASSTMRRQLYQHQI